MPLTAEDKALRKEAYRLTNRAIRQGTIVRQETCADCGGAHRIHAHHHKGYGPEHATDVVFICESCHDYRHRYGHRKSEVLPLEVQEAYKVITEWFARPREEGV